MRSTGDVLAALRKLMANLPNSQGSINAYIIPSEDAHQSEYLAKRDERRAFITGFDGSAGTAVVTENEALLWTDGRYYQQASKQMDTNWTLMRDGQPTTPTIDAWLAKTLKPGSKVGVDANLIPTRAWNPLQSSLKSAGCLLLTISPNLIDLIWKDQPVAPRNPIIPLSVEYAGRSVAEKLVAMREKMTDKRASVVVVSALDEIAWFLNLRGSDIDYNPVFFSYLLVTLDDVYFFVDESKLSSAVNDHFRANKVELKIRPYGDIKEALKSLAETCENRVWISLGSNYALSALIPEEKRFHEITPINLMKAVKNEVEAAGMRQCHIRDGVALCQYFAWLERCIKERRSVDEISGASQLEKFRSVQDKFMGLSFTTISASGPNGSIMHYHPLPETNRPITDKEMYLCDSGAQFLDGTTDVTRTLHFGTPTEEEITAFTHVLKGQIALGTAIFPRKVKGQFLDTIARKALWDVGLDYGHGTGHGIGHFLNVHEGPMGIGIRLMPDDPGLEENMFLSNEPGYYKDEHFGIRIEDIVQVIPTSIGDNFNGRGALCFRTITMCPIQTKLINVKLLTDKERNSLNRYHQTVWETLSPLLKKANDAETLAWLERETQPI
ncbi:xaa-Pro aminopeptidase ApepP [Malaya genurostris]|uniref:xaa-Pro aminopeptidase ApepP n=1 Tax=Malaya genurostris TaxID=325434 RepID=UPI0026F4063D|nr:xaa-Pro aminopeptidase ApepP [Malaya genurostris]XP_058444566.1 xaa-Pro aminopeptidase ApepP [Malaya genurostris]XP_058444567.1 xaa-Pro aminopeptidase ApepP [Malaya genurostris]XP_058444568.1 xaa-Pro aminopeptidase ApepP [Malaya genurostris]XP_058444569.1 xaa-Pro aminopeptidase ApepP [Malaya genurostris]